MWLMLHKGETTYLQKTFQPRWPMLNQGKEMCLRFLMSGKDQRVRVTCVSRKINSDRQK